MFAIQGSMIIRNCVRELSSGGEGEDIEDINTSG